MCSFDCYILILYSDWYVYSDNPVFSDCHKNHLETLGLYFKSLKNTVCVLLIQILMVYSFFHIVAFCVIIIHSLVSVFYSTPLYGVL